MKEHLYKLLELLDIKNESTSILCLIIIVILNINSQIMTKCYYEIIKISKLFPPQKNENKFIYGKLCEKALIIAMQNIGLNCIDLDNNHKVGSEYKNDIKLENKDFSIKTKLNKGGDIIMINKKSKTTHSLVINTIICSINEGKLYFIPSNIFNIEKYFKVDAGTISYKGSLLTLMNKEYKQYIYTFPNLSVYHKNELDIIKEVDIYNILYKEYIKVK